MRKLTLLIFALLFTTATIAEAQFTGNEKAVTVQQVKDSQDDGTFVTLEGFIVKNLGDEHYRFQDDTGDIEVEIDDEIWRGQEVNPDTKVRIQGEVDEDLTSVSIEVERLSIIAGGKSSSGGWN